MKKMTVPEIFQAVGDDTLARWEALGQTESKINWAYAKEAQELIDEGFPAMNVYKAISIKSNVTSQTVRKSYKTFSAFDPKSIQKYDECPYSVFQIAKSQDKPEEVLQYYLDNRCSIDELKSVFPNVKSEPKETFEQTGYPRYFWGILRAIYGAPPKKVAEVTEHLDRIHEIIQELEEK